MVGAMAEQPMVCDTKPLGMEMEPGSYWWCACGRSAGQPFCDGSHQGTGIQPVKHEVSVAGTVWWCQCKHSGNGALCDGTHRTLG